MKIEVGKTYRDRSGGVHFITHPKAVGPYVCLVSMHGRYYEYETGRLVTTNGEEVTRYNEYGQLVEEVNSIEEVELRLLTEQQQKIEADMQDALKARQRAILSMTGQQVAREPQEAPKAPEPTLGESLTLKDLKDLRLMLQGVTSNYAGRAYTQPAVRAYRALWGVWRALEYHQQPLKDLALLDYQHLCDRVDYAVRRLQKWLNGE